MNKVILIGNLTREPEMGTTKSGIAYCRFCIAVQRDYRDADGNRGADFFNCVAWRNTAEYCGKYLNKGSKLTVCGRLTTNTYETNDGTKRQNIEITVEEADIVFARAAEGEQREDKTSASMTPVDDELPF